MRICKRAVLAALISVPAIGVAQEAQENVDSATDEIVVVGRSVSTSTSRVEVEREILVDTAVALKEIPGANVSRFVLPAASYEQEQGGLNWSAELNSVLSDSLLLNARMAINRGYINGGGENNPDTISGHYNQDTFIQDGNYSSTFENDRDRDEY